MSGGGEERVRKTGPWGFYFERLRDVYLPSLMQIDWFLNRFCGLLFFETTLDVQVKFYKVIDGAARFSEPSLLQAYWVFGFDIPF
jgi:hypothetical protein